MALTDKFIVLEGIDGCGKSTVAVSLSHELISRGFDTLVTHQPSAGPVGDLITDMLGGAKVDIKLLALLFAADRLDHFTKVIEPALAVGKVVICDRYRLSGLVYQSPHVGLEWVQHIDKVPDPAYTFVLDIDPYVAIKRITSRGKALDFFERVDKLERLRSGYTTLPKDTRCNYGGAVHVIPVGTLTTSQIIEYIIERLSFLSA